MKRLIAKRKLKRKCDFCNRKINKGEVYYRQREVWAEDEMVAGYSLYICSKCKWKKESRNKRFERFKENCIHPERYRYVLYSYIPGEAVMEPSHEKCLVCGQIV